MDMTTHPFGLSGDLGNPLSLVPAHLHIYFWGLLGGDCHLGCVSPTLSEIRTSTFYWQKCQALYVGHTMDMGFRMWDRQRKCWSKEIPPLVLRWGCLLDCALLFCYALKYPVGMTTGIYWKSTSRNIGLMLVNSLGVGESRQNDVVKVFEGACAAVVRRPEEQCWEWQIWNNDLQQCGSVQKVGSFKCLFFFFLNIV